MFRLFSRAFSCGQQSLLNNLILARLSVREPSKNVVGEHPCWVRIDKTILTDGVLDYNNVYINLSRNSKICIDLQKSEGVDIFVKSDHKDINHCIYTSYYY